MSTTTAQTTQVYSLFIRATPEQVWDAITKPEFTRRYFHGTSVTVGDGRYLSLAPDGSTPWVDGEVFEHDPPRRLVHEWRSLYDEELGAEEPSRVSWELEPQEGGVTKLTVVHDRLEGAPRTAASVAGGWMRILSSMKTLLETGEPLPR